MLNKWIKLKIRSFFKNYLLAVNYKSDENENVITYIIYNKNGRLLNEYNLTF